jgi:hypothetical protein
MLCRRSGATQEFRKDFANASQVARATLRLFSTAEAGGGIATMTTNTKKVSKLRMAAGVAVGTVGLSLVGSLMPAVASADPWVPYSGPLHPVRHYAADVLHPLWTLTHPLRAAIP